MTGSSGLLGATLSRLLISHQWSVTGIDRVPGTFTTIVADVTTSGVFGQLLDNVDAVFHTASLHVPDLTTADTRQFFAVNIDATRALLDAARRAGVRHVVYTSTTSVYGSAMVDSDRAVFVTEDLEPGPRDIYDSTKLAAEALCRDACTSDMRGTCLRVSRFFPEPAVTALLHRLHRGVDVQDAAEAHVLAVGRSGPAFDLFNISAQSPFVPADAEKLADAADTVIARHYPDARPLLARFGWRLPTHIDRVYVIGKAVRELGFKPRKNFRQLLDDFASGTLSDPKPLAHLRPCA